MTQSLNKSISIKEVQEIYSKQLPHTELNLILELILNKSSLYFITEPYKKIAYSDIKLLEKFIKRRLNGEPIAYILGKKEFYGREFKISSDTLVPRPESELIIDIIKKDLNNNHETFIFLDIGTGSGNLITTLYCEFLNKKNIINYIATDISNDALEIAKNNFKKYTTKELNFFNSDLLTDKKLFKYLINSCSNIENLVIVANLPYVDILLKKELLVKQESCGLKFEPDIALWSKDKGLWHYKQLISQIFKLKSYLSKTKITSFYEINPDQNILLKKIIKSHSYKKITTYKDLSKKNRIIKHSF